MEVGLFAPRAARLPGILEGRELMRRRKGLALAGVVALCLMAGSLLTWMFLSLAWSQES